MTAPRIDRRLLAGVGVAVALAALAGLPGRATYGARTSADEPYYLLTALSLAADGDLDIADELAAGATAPFHEVPVDEQTRPLADGRRLSPHDPMLPLLLAPSVAAAGWVGAKALLALLAGALAALTTWVAVRRLGVRPRVAAGTAVALGAAIPLAPYGGQVYPELPAALVVLGAVALGTDLAGAAPRALAVRAAAVLALLVALPWLSVKYVPVTAALALALGWTGRRELGRRGLLIAVGLLAVAGVAYLGAHQVLYGGWTVYAVGDHFARSGELSVVGTDPDHVGRARRLIGLLVDRRFGIGTWAPLWLALFPAAAVALRAGRHRAAVLAPLAAAWLTATFVALTMHGWWVPGRQVVVALPLAALLIAGLLDRFPALQVPAVLAGVAGIANWLHLAVEAATGRRTLIVDFDGVSAPAYRVMATIAPDGIAGRALDDALLLAWTAVLLGGAAWAWHRVGAAAGDDCQRRGRTGSHDAIEHPARGRHDPPDAPPPVPRRGRSRTAAAVVVAVAGTAVALGIIGRAVDVSALRQGLITAAGDGPGMALALGAFGAAFGLRAMAWRQVLPSLALGHALAAIHVASAGNHVLPLRLGEPLRVASVVRRAGVGVAEATSSTVALRLADVFALLLLGLAAGPTAVGAVLGPWAGAAVVTVGLGVLGAGAILVRQRRRGSDVRVPGATAITLTTAAWALEAVLVWQVARWLDVDLTPAGAVVVLAAAVGAQLVAITPGGIGTYEGAATAALVALGTPAATAVAVAVAVHGLKTVYALSAGAVAAVAPAPGLAGRLRLPAAVPARPRARPADGPIVLFMPALDEGPRVASVVRRAPSAIHGIPVRILVVDDGSSDGTAAAAAAAGADVVVHDRNRGLGAAVRTGLAWATDVGARAVAFCDADGEYDPAALADLVSPILDGRADYVVGSRFAGTIRHMRPHRRIGNLVLTGWVRWTVRQPVTDGQSGYRAFSPAAAAAAVIPHDYNYAQVLTIDLLARGHRYHEVGIDYAFRASGDSFVRLGRYLRRVVPAVWRQLNPPRAADRFAFR